MAGLDLVKLDLSEAGLHHQLGLDQLGRALLVVGLDELINDVGDALGSGYNESQQSGLCRLKRRRPSLIDRTATFRIRQYK